MSIFIKKVVGLDTRREEANLDIIKEERSSRNLLHSDSKRKLISPRNPSI